MTETGKVEIDHYTSGERVVVRDFIGSGKEPSPGDRAMMVYLLMHGGVMRNWSSYPEVDHRVMHILACGVNWDQSSPVSDDTWRDSGDTFSEGERHSGIGSGITCQCGEVENLHVVCEIESYVDLIKAMVT